MSQYTETERAALKGAFLQARKRLATRLVVQAPHHSASLVGAHGKARYICVAIERAEREGFVSIGIGGLAKRIILDRMNCYSFERWLKTESGVSVWEIEKDIDKKKGVRLQATRRAWLDSLIQEFS